MKQPKKTRLAGPIFHTLAVIPLVVMMFTALGATTGLIGGAQFLEISGGLADISTFFFTAVLACTPLNILFGWRQPLALKKPLGLYTFMYASLHYFVFSSAFGFDIGATVTATMSSYMLIFGFLALVLLVPLALTSNRWSMKTLGRGWKRLHYLTYVIAVFIVLHLLMLGDGQILAVLYATLLAIRLPPIKKAIRRQRREESSRSRLASSF